MEVANVESVVSDTEYPDLADRLWRERELLEQVLFELAVEQLVVSSGQARWLPIANRRLDLALEQLRATEISRSMESDRLCERLGPRPRHQPGRHRRHRHRTVGLDLHRAPRRAARAGRRGPQHGRAESPAARRGVPLGARDPRLDHRLDRHVRLAGRARERLHPALATGRAGDDQFRRPDECGGGPRRAELRHADRRPEHRQRRHRRLHPRERRPVRHRRRRRCADAVRDTVEDRAARSPSPAPAGSTT